MCNKNEIWYDKIKKHYDINQIMFSLFWSPDYLRYGIYDENTKSLKESLRNTDKIVAKKLSLQEGKIYLDAGCGVGGTALFFAENYGVKVVGINISDVQLNIAKKKAKKKNLENLVNFEYGDYTKTHFEDNTFDGIFAIESIYHTNKTNEFAQECFRLLVPNGKLVIVDRFLFSKILAPDEMKYYEIFKKGQAVSELPYINDIISDLKETGFQEINFEDKTKNVIKSVKESTYTTKLALPFIYILTKVGIMKSEIFDHAKSLLAIEKLFENKKIGYGIISATKFK